MGKKKANDGSGHTDLTRVAYEGIRHMMFHNEIVPGQKISYRELSERLGMSVTPVIQALKFLEFQNLVRHEPNRGYYTEPIDMHEVEEIYVTREIIEVPLLQETFSKLDEAGTIKLQAAFNAYSSAACGKSFVQRLITDRDFHLTLAGLSGCRIRFQILRLLFDLLYLKFGGNLVFGPYTRYKDSLSESLLIHRSILEAVVVRDLPRAEKLMSEHIKQTKDQVLSDLSQLITEKETQVF